MTTPTEALSAFGDKTRCPTHADLVGIVLGGKAVTAAQNAGLPDDVLEAIAAAPRYAEGTGLRLPVSNADQLPAIQTLVALKMTSAKPARGSSGGSDGP